MNTPLDLASCLGPAAWERLPPAVRERFAADHGDADYRGFLNLRCSNIGQLFAWAGRLLGSPLLGGAPRCLDTLVRVRRLADGSVAWERCLADGSCVRSIKQAADGAFINERTSGGLGMRLLVSEQDGALVFESLAYWLQLGPLRLPLPELLTPGRCRVEHRDLGGGRFIFCLAMRHPLWGETFHQHGVFEAVAHP